MSIEKDCIDNLEVKEQIEFGVGGVPIGVAARVLGMKPDTVRNLMELEKINIGKIWYSSKKRGVRRYRNTYISPKLFYELTGYIYRKEDKPCTTTP